MIAVARQFDGRQVCVYGESAGGGLAAMLAVRRGLVDAAVLDSPLLDLTDPRWADDGPAFRCRCMHCLHRYSPSRRHPKAPVLQFVPTDDQAVDPRDAIRWGHREPLVHTDSFPGLHMFPSPRGRKGDLVHAAR